MKKALVLSLIVVLGLSVASFAQMGEITGTWDTMVTILPTLGIASTINVTYSVSGWDFTSTTAITNTGWTDQTFAVTGNIGAFSIGSLLDFTPAPPAFQKWETTAGLSLAGVTIDGTFTLVPNNTQLVLDVSGTAGTVVVDGSITFGDLNGTDGCDLDWAGVKIGVDFPFCCAIVESEISFLCSGFEYVSFTVSDIALPNVPWLTLAATVKFDLVNGKTLTLTPGVDFGTTACFNLWFADVAGQSYPGGGALSFGTFAIVGIGIECTTPGGVSFEGVSYWGAAAGAPAWLNGYWEGYRIYTDDDSCCDGTFDFSLAFLFDDAGQLFDLAEIDASFDITISQLTFGLVLEMDLQTVTTWKLHFLVEF